MAGVRDYKGWWLSGDVKGCYLRDTVAELVHAWCLHDARMTYAWYMCGSPHGTCLGEEVAERLQAMRTE